MLKIFGLALVGLSVASIGFLYSQRLMFRKRYLEQFVLFSKNLTNEMRIRNSNVISIFSDVTAKELKFLKNITKEDFSDGESIKDKVRTAGVFPEDNETVTSFLVKLGTSDLEGQRIHCEYYANVFADKCREAERLISEKGKPARILSVLGGLALFIILV